MKESWGGGAAVQLLHDGLKNEFVPQSAGELLCRGLMCSGCPVSAATVARSKLLPLWLDEEEREGEVCSHHPHHSSMFLTKRRSGGRVWAGEVLESLMVFKVHHLITPPVGTPVSFGSFQILCDRHRAERKEWNNC